MAFNLGKKKGPIADINVTPLVDVMLVLLVIFMISAPLMYSGVVLKLPKTKKVSTLKLDNKQVILSIDDKKQLYLDKEIIPEDKLIKTVLSRMSQVNTDVLYVRGDYQLDYGTVAKLIANLKKSGVSNISLVTEIEK